LQVNPRTASPLWSIGTTATIAVLLSLINIGSDVALNDVLSLSISALYISYLLALVFLLHRRMTGAIRLPSIEHGNEKVLPGNLIWGPWRIDGILGTANNVFACLYLILVLFFSFWPPATPVESPDQMNYSVLVTGAVAIFSVVYYYVWAKRDYDGPIVEV
jgi:amino acid transporter